MNQSIKIILSTALILLIPLKAFSATMVEKVVAVVNEEVITLSELQDETDKLNKSLEKKLEQRMVLEKMIDQKILDQEAGKRGIVVSEAELDATIGELKKRFNINEENIESELKKQNLTLEEFREQWRYQLLSKKLLDTNLKGKIAVSEDEIVDYYRENYGGGEEIEYESQVRISHILIPLDEENALEKSTEIANMAKSGKDFAGLAKEYSKDSLSASKGGDLGYFNKGDLVVELEQAIEQTEIGGITDPIITSGGYHIVKVTDRKKSDTASVGNYRDEIKQTLYNKKLEEFLKNWISDLKDDSYIEIKI